ncbi:MAG TPA: FAD-dependent oxidoreductase, partial [Ilumatobacteraceae bacterium]
FGSQVTVIGMEKTLFPELAARVGEIVAHSLRGAGVDLVLGRTARAARSTAAGIELELDDGSTVAGDRVVVAVGKRARLHGLGLASVGLDETKDLPVGDDGRIDVAGSMWAIGDVAGKGQYTHLANHQARVVAANLVGGSRRFDEVTVPRCVFTDPPVAMVGPTRDELDGDDDVVWRERPVTDVARATTDATELGHFALAARRSTGTLVAGHGVGPHFDELIHAITFAIDGRVPVHELTRSMQPFPTFGELLGVLLSDLARDIGAADPAG